MFFYEFILLILGSILFLALLIILIIYAVKSRPLKGLLPFFIIPILMIGYPGYQKISYDNGVVTIEKQLKEVANNPSDSTARKNLEQTLSEIQERPTTNTKVLVDAGKASAVIGDTLKALSFLKNALQIKPDLIEANNLKKKYSTPRVRLEKLSDDLQKNPTNSSTRKELESDLKTFQDTTKLNAAAYTTIANAHLLLGDTIKAKKYTDSALIKNPTYIKAKELNKKLIIKNR